MSRRRHTSATLAHGSRHAFFVALSIALLVTAVRPLAVAGQSINDRDVDKKWQLLTYLPPDSRELQPVPAGVGAGVSFPSGHVAMAMVPAVLPFALWRAGRRCFAVFAMVGVVLLGATVALGRIVAGRHYLTDTLFSMGAALLLASLLPCRRCQ